MPKAASLKIACRDDRLFAFAPETTALLVIDMQREFFAPEEDGEPSPMREIVPRVAALAALARRLGGRGIHTREGYAPDPSDGTPYRASLDYVGYEGDLGRSLIRGEPSHDFIDEMKPEPGETVVDKAGFSAFYASPLDNVLRASGIDHLLIAGVTTQCCVHSTLRDAVDRGYWCVTVADCCAASEPELHDAALWLIAGEGHLFGWICDLADIERAAGTKARTAARKSVSGSRSGANPRPSKPRPPREGR